MVELANAEKTTISIHAPREGRDNCHGTGTGTDRHFNPRAPRGARPKNTKHNARDSEFQSTRPARGATVSRIVSPTADAISIHAPREGRDRSRAVTRLQVHHFNPRAPRGARLSMSAILSLFSSFQSTRPARGATLRVSRSHTPVRYFNPRAPRGARRLLASDESIVGALFQSTRPARGAT